MEALSRISTRAGCTARTEPTYVSMGVATAGRQGAWVIIEVTLPPPHGATWLGASMIQPRCPTYFAAASHLRCAALHNRGKDRAYAGHLHPGHTFVPASVESYRHIGRPVMPYIRTLSDVALARSLAVTRVPFPASVHRKPIVALVQSQGYVYRSFALLLAKGAG
jgi:hypothetical protein